jgi:hypothetical protein
MGDGSKFVPDPYNGSELALGGAAFWSRTDVRIASLLGKLSWLKLQECSPIASFSVKFTGTFEGIVGMKGSQEICESR